MHGPMNWSGHHMGHGGGSHMEMPMIPAPMAMCTMLIGVMIGVMIGRKKSMMHGMGSSMGSGMHGGWGMSHGGGCGTPQSGGGWGDWAMKKKMMMGGMEGHHHHGDGGPACTCGCETSEEPEGTAGE